MNNIADPEKLSSNFEEFRALADYGFSLIRMRGKRPIEKQWQRWCHESRSYDDIGFQHNDNAGITCGGASDLIVLDIDDQKAFDRCCAERGWTVPPTLTVQTGGGGLHYYFRYPTDGKEYGNKARKRWGFDIRGMGGCVVAPGSIHPDTGKQYRIVNGDVNSIATSPAWMLDLYRGRVSNEQVSDSSDSFDGIPKGISPRIRNYIETGMPTGERSEPMMSVIDALVAAGMNDDQITTVFERYPIGEKYHEKGGTKRKWLQSQIDKARRYVDMKQGSQYLMNQCVSRKPFPLDCIPESYRNTVNEIADAVGTKIELPAVALLSMVGACIGRTRSACPKRGWTEHANLYIALIGPSGIGKTPTTQAMFKQVRVIEELWYREYSRSQQGDLPMPYRQLIVDDATPEALGCAFEDNPRGILWNRDELAGLFQDMDKYSNKEGGTMSRLMSAYDSGPWVINRADKSKNRRIPHATLSIFGTIQPQAVTEIFNKRDIEVGFVPRFLFVMVEQDQPGLWSEKEISYETDECLKNLVTVLVTYDFDESGRPIEIKLSADAKATYTTWYNKIQYESWMDVDSEHMQTIAKKLHAQCLRLALILHCIEAVSENKAERDPITKETMERAIQLAEYFKHQKYAVMQLILTKQTQSLPPIVKHTATAIIQLEDEIDRAMLATARITEVVNQSLDESFQVKSEAVGKAATALGLSHKQMPDGKSRGIVVQPEDMERLQILLETLSKPSKPSNQDDE